MLTQHSFGSPTVVLRPGDAAHRGPVRGPRLPGPHFTRRAFTPRACCGPTAVAAGSASPIRGFGTRCSSRLFAVERSRLGRPVQHGASGDLVRGPGPPEPWPRSPLASSGRVCALRAGHATLDARSPCLRSTVCGILRIWLPAATGGPRDSCSPLRVSGPGGRCRYFSRPPGYRVMGKSTVRAC
jgi:hypothetical protein